ncbi:S9 family peptidase [Sphingomonas sp. AR_OL41]|uniref:alpha/beta hydrolase family protein n=1 Tax=Sphingomonas sp. AR_OL41 TaxID=3042729 RepID=UPI00247FF63F|nr:S9 family peptidase [Sphingomonas sp. AR_OL41]MDH7974918.1 S9 family peptidase [Sphingomonas sp. AR_OL41]
MIRSPIAAAALLLTTHPAEAASDAAMRFGAREDVQQISLSPDGKRVAVVQAAAGHGMALLIASPDTGAAHIALQASGDPDHLTSCRWATNDRLTCRISMIIDNGTDKLSYSRIIAVDADGKNLKVLVNQTTFRSLGVAQDGGRVIDWQTGRQDGSVLMSQVYVPEYSTGTHLASDREGLGVDRVDTVTLKRTNVETPQRDVVEYISDGQGTVRIMATRGSDSRGYDKNTVRYLYRAKGSRQWQALGTVTYNGDVSSGFVPVAVDSERDVAYGFDAANGHTALFSVALDGSGKRESLLARNDVDIDDVVRIGRQNRVVGASFVTDRRQVEFFDPAVSKIVQSLSKALPKLPLISIIDASADENRLLLFAGSDTDAGHYYLFDKTTHQLAEVLLVRPQLTDVTLSPVKPISFPAADGTMIPAYLTLPPGSDGKNLPGVVLPHGGPDARDEWGFDWLAQFLAHRGYAVLQPNFRGSTGYGEAYFAKNGFQSWQTAIGDVTDGGRWLVKQGIADPAKLAIVGWSYGGYAALQSNVVDPALFKAVIAVAPVTDLETLRMEHQNFTDFYTVDAQIGRGVHVRAGSPAQNAARFVAPVLMFHGDTDVNVGVGESRLMASRLKGAGKSVELVEYHHLDHQLDDSNVRAEMLDKMDAFLRTSLHLPPAP